MVECIKRYCIILLLRICGFGNLLRNEKKKKENLNFFVGLEMKILLCLLVIVKISKKLLVIVLLLKL